MSLWLEWSVFSFWNYPYTITPHPSCCLLSVCITARIWSQSTATHQKRRDTHPAEYSHTPSREQPHIRKEQPHIQQTTATLSRKQPPTQQGTATYKQGTATYKQRTATYPTENTHTPNRQQPHTSREQPHTSREQPHYQQRTATYRAENRSQCELIVENSHQWNGSSSIGAGYPGELDHRKVRILLCFSRRTSQALIFGLLVFGSGLFLVHFSAEFRWVCRGKGLM